MPAGPGGERLHADIGVSNRGHTRTCQNTETIPVQIRERIRGGGRAECARGGERASGIEAVGPAPLSVLCAGVPGDNRRRAWGGMEAKSAAGGVGDIQSARGGEPSREGGQD